ncbi:MAG TPA: CsgG/HfaB family protein [Burkholderiaceae bacterium]|nr:CsgG/HfaB family protein [Burkholderiaceae bacterium]
MKTLAFLALALLWPLQANAEIVVVQAKGYGDTYEQAVESALGDAVKQVNGASVATRSASPKAYVQVKDAKETRTQGSADTSLKKETREGGIFHDTVTDNTDTAKSAFDNTTATSGKTALEIGVGSSNEVRSQGKVKSYKVLSQECTDKGCQAELEVAIEKFEYKSKAAKLERDSISVVATGRLRNSKTAAQLRQAVTDKLVRSGRFTVLDRGNEAEIEKELAFLDSDKVSDEQRARLGQALGADYLLVLNLTQAGVATKVKETHVDMTGEYSREVSHSTSASMRYSLVESATRAVKWSDSMSFRSGGSQVNAAMDTFLDKVVGEVGEIINPPKVVGVHNGKVIINRGAGIAAAGQTYDIYSVGEELVDPDTGETLGATEENIATIRIVDVKPKLAYGEIVKGSADAVEKGAIARMKAPAAAPAKKKAPARKAKPSESDQNIDAAGGVIL